MTLLEQLHAEHKARQRRLSPPPKRQAAVPDETPELKRRIEELEAANRDLEKLAAESAAKAEEKIARIYRASMITERVPPKWRPKVARIIQACAEHFGLDVDDIYADRRKVKYVTARRAAMYLTKRMTMGTLPWIAMAFGRDHTTILHAVRKAEFQYAADDKYAEIIDSIELKLLAESAP